MRVFVERGGRCPGSGRQLVNGVCSFCGKPPVPYFKKRRDGAAYPHSVGWLESNA